MTSTQAAYDAGIRAALAMAEAVADGIEAQPSKGLRHQSAAQALRSLAAEGRATLLIRPDPNSIRTAFAMIAEEPGGSGTIPCPRCAGRLRWTRDADNGHIHGRCEATGCLTWMQ